MTLRTTFTALGLVALGATAATPALAQSGMDQQAMMTSDTEQQQAMMGGVVDKHMLGMPVVQSDGSFVGWLTGVDLPGEAAGMALIEQPPLADENVDVMAMDRGALSLQGDTLVIGGSPQTARAAEYSTDGGDIID